MRIIETPIVLLAVYNGIKGREVLLEEEFVTKFSQPKTKIPQSSDKNNRKDYEQEKNKSGPAYTILNPWIIKYTEYT